MTLAAWDGAEIILLQELFQTRYFCIEKDWDYQRHAKPLEADRAVQHFSALAKRLWGRAADQLLETAGNTLFNSLAMIDADEAVPGNSRKTHIPHATGFEEKVHVTPGNTGFRVF